MARDRTLGRISTVPMEQLPRGFLSGFPQKLSGLGAKIMSKSEFGLEIYLFIFGGALDSWLTSTRLLSSSLLVVFEEVRPQFVISYIISRHKSWATSHREEMLLCTECGTQKIFRLPGLG